MFEIESIFKILEIFIFPGFLFIGIISLLYEWIDRKFYAKLQNRVGPLYAGPFGILQPLADFIKLIAKEDIVPKAADKMLFTLTPIFSFSIMLTATLLLPIINTSGILSFNGDVIFAIAIMTLFCILVFCAGLSSNNRFSAVGAERAVLQLLGYEIPLMLSIVGVSLNVGFLRISEIVKYQSTHPWLIFGPQALGFAIYVIAAQAELERIPFDIPEAEQEIVAGWLTEFSGRKLALFRFARDLELVYISGLAVALYLGGPLGPVIPGLESFFYTFYFIIKTIIVLLILSTIRALFARLRIDQMVNFSWNYLLPLSVLQFFLVRLVI